MKAFLKDFILYARNNIAPEISEEAVEGLVQVSQRGLDNEECELNLYLLIVIR